MLMDNFVSSKSLAEGAKGDGAISRFHNIKVIFSGALLREVLIWEAIYRELTVSAKLSILSENNYCIIRFAKNIFS
jgi:hypothetical protein